MLITEENACFLLMLIQYSAREPLMVEGYGMMFLYEVRSAINELLYLSISLR